MHFACWHPDKERKPHRWDAFKAGLNSCGYDEAPFDCLGPGDVFVTWNRHVSKDGYFRHLEWRGVRVCVVENAYIGDCDERLYAIGWGDHATLGNCRVGSEDRWQAQGIVCEPWRTTGRDVVILAQRGIGRPPVASPSGWEARAYKEISAVTKRPVRIRQHPGRDAPHVSLETDLENAWCVVTWASAAAIRAIAMGVPCLYGYHGWIGQQGAAPYHSARIDQPERPDRITMLRTISHAQWTASEISGGAPFRQPKGDLKNARD